MKKKGLIISTVVMVVVLIASLTTATYAWFSSTSQVTVDNLSITTVATDGLQIAMKNGDNNYASGSDLVFKNGNWEGSSDTWGSSLSFKDFVSDGDNEGVVEFAGMEDAVTRVSDANHAYEVDKSAENTKFTYASYKGVALYSDKACNTQVFAAGGSESDWNSAIAPEGAIGKVQGNILYAKYPINTFLVPTGYDAAIKPTGYRPAQMNVDYAYLPIVVRATSADVMQIFYEVKVTPIVTNIQADFQPGMAAASRIKVNEELNAPYKQDINPYNDAKMTDTMMQSTKTNQKYGNATPYTYTGFIYNGYTAPVGDTAAQKVSAGTAEKTFYLLIWIEGTDTECTNTTAGSGMTIDVAIDYKKLDTPQPVTADQLGEGKTLASLGGQYQS